MEKNTIAPNTLVTLSRSKPELPADFSAGCLILVNKPLEWTSFDVVNRIKYAIKHNHGLPGIKVGAADAQGVRIEIPVADGFSSGSTAIRPSLAREDMDCRYYGLHTIVYVSLFST